MSSELLSQTFHLWKDERIGRPPQRKELALEFSEIRKALLSFKFDMQSGLGTKLDPTQAVLINDKPISTIDLPQNKKSKSLEFVERNDLDITALIRTGAGGAKNVFEVNYLLTPIGVINTQVPGQTLGTLSLDVKIFYPGIKTVQIIPPNSKFCMWDGKAIPRNSVVCPFCQKSPPQGGSTPKKCNNCGELLPPQALFCEECGHQQATESPATRFCANCNKPISTNAIFCDSCGAKQPENKEFREEKTFCVRCGNPLAADVTYCNKCGAQQPKLG